MRTVSLIVNVWIFMCATRSVGLARQTTGGAEKSVRMLLRFISLSTIGSFCDKRGVLHVAQLIAHDITQTHLLNLNFGYSSCACFLEVLVHTDLKIKRYVVHVLGHRARADGRRAPGKRFGHPSPHERRGPSGASRCRFGPSSGTRQRSHVRRDGESVDWRLKLSYVKRKLQWFVHSSRRRRRTTTMRMTRRKVNAAKRGDYRAAAPFNSILPR